MSVSGPFRDRLEAGRLLADRLAAEALPGPLLVLGLPRGGVPVAFEVAERLDAPLDVLVVRKLGHPLQPELAIGAIASGGVLVLNPEAASDVSQAAIDRIAERELTELERREVAYRDQRPGEDPAGRTVILVDDGLATGSTMRAAIGAVRKRKPAMVAVAVPVAPSSTAADMERLADRFVCLVTADWFGAVGAWYEDFAPTSDEEVRRLLAQAAVRRPVTDAGAR